MPQRLRGEVSQGYGWRNAGFVRNDYEYIGQIAPAGSASSTAGDMSRFMLALLGEGASNGVTIFGPQAARAFRSPLRRTPEGINGWPHGFMAYTLPGDFRAYGHGGATIAFHSNMMVIPELGLGVFISTNSEGGADVAATFPAAVVRHFYAQPTVFPRPGSAELAQAGALFEGSYLSTRRAHGGLEGFVGLLINGVQVDVTSGGRLLTRPAMGPPKAWVPDGPIESGRFVSVLGDSRLVFHMEQGRGASFRTGMNTDTNRRAGLSQEPLTILAMSVLTGLAAVATLGGLTLRNKRELRQNQIQARAAMVQNLQAGLWIAAFIFFALWASGSADIQRVMYGWPGPLLITASACALVAAALNLLTIAAIPSVWQGGRRVDSWPVTRKLAFTFSVLIYTAFTVLLAMNGALEPWSR
jgi:hypothetical protein